jgi:hypothetical protein
MIIGQAAGIAATIAIANKLPSRISTPNRTLPRRWLESQWRVPERSVIYRAFEQGAHEGRVLDFAAGYGRRLLGAQITGREYYEIDRHRGVARAFPSKSD